MKNRSNNQQVSRAIVLVMAVFNMSFSGLAFGQQDKVLLFDTFHGQRAQSGDVFNLLLPDRSGSGVQMSSAMITDSLLNGKSGLILFSPNKAFQETEKTAIINYLQTGGSLLLIFDEEKRVSLNGVGVNDIISPFGIELTEDAPVKHNCGAIADSSEICAGRRELPYSGGRSIRGGTVVSRVYDEGDYIHSAYLKLPAGGKIIIMSDGMAGLLLGRPDGERFSGTGPSDSKYWGKDSRIFMQEILTFLVK